MTPTADSKITLAVVDDHKMLLGALTEWIRGAASDIQLVAAVASWPELLTHPSSPSTSSSSTSTSRTTSRSR